MRQVGSPAARPQSTQASTAHDAHAPDRPLSLGSEGGFADKGDTQIGGGGGGGGGGGTYASAARAHTGKDDEETVTDDSDGDL
jgi:hypothetical protein